MNENHEHEFPDELISAYLDGELSPAEKLRVEEQLMDSAEHRRLFEELKALRRSLQALPAESLGEDFAARVLRRAERELLADVSAPEANKGQETSPAPPVITSATEAKRVALPNRAHGQRGARRGLVWSVIATAAAVGFLIYGPLLNQEQRQLTQGTASPEAVQLELSHGEKLNAPQSTGNSSSENKPLGRAIEETMTPTPPVEFAAPVDAVRDQEIAGPASAAPAREAAAESAEMAKERERFGNGGARYNSANGFSDGRALRGAAPGGAGLKDNQLDRQARQAAEKAMADAPSTLGKASEVEEQIGPQVAGGAGRVNLPAGNMRARGQGDAASSAPSTIASPTMLVVTVDVKRSALSSMFFDEMLQRHDIHVESSADNAAQVEQEDQVASDDRLGDNSLADESDGDKGDGEGRNLRSPGEGVATSGGGQPAAFGSDWKQRADHEDVDLMYVEATQSQIDGLLRDLRAQPDDVVAMTYGDDFLAKEKTFAEANGLQTEQPFRELMETKELEQLNNAALSSRPSDSDGVVALSEPTPEAGAKPGTPLEKPFSQAAADVARVDALGAADRKQDDLKLAEARKSGFARRLSLQDGRVPGKLELQGGAGNAVASSAAAPAPLTTAAPTDVAGEPLSAEAAGVGLADAGADPQSDLASDLPRSEADVSEAASPAAPPANLTVEGRQQVAKAKKQEQTRVRVLFVLRAVAPSLAAEAEAAPAEPQAEPQQP